MGVAYTTQNFGPDPSPEREMLAIGEVAYKLLNLSVTAETRKILLNHGMPPGEVPTIGNMFEMILAPELPLLEAATDRERQSWGEWAARLMVLYGFHVRSDGFLMNQLKAIKLVQFFDLPEEFDRSAAPFSRSDFDVLSFSRVIATQIGERIGGVEGPTLGRAFQFELQRCGKLFDTITALATDASRKMQAG